jgi:hypothetical protein
VQPRRQEVRQGCVLDLEARPLLAPASTAMNVAVRGGSCDRPRLGRASRRQAVELTSAWHACMLPFLPNTFPPRPCVYAVSRYVCKSDLFECDMVLDVNIDVYPLEVGHWAKPPPGLHGSSLPFRTGPHPETLLIRGHGCPELLRACTAEQEVPCGAQPNAKLRWQHGHGQVRCGEHMPISDGRSQLRAGGAGWGSS